MKILNPLKSAAKFSRMSCLNRNSVAAALPSVVSDPPQKQNQYFTGHLGTAMPPPPPPDRSGQYELNKSNTENGDSTSRLSSPDTRPADDAASTLDCELMEGPLCLSFSGCGFLGTYHFGVIDCLRAHSSNTLLPRVEKYAGASAGSLAAALLLLCPDKIPMCLDKFYALGDEIIKLRFGALTPGYSLMSRLRALTEQNMPDDAHIKASGRLFISCTNMFDRQGAPGNRLFSEFHDRERLMLCLMASCYIPIYAGTGEKPVLIDDRDYVDGGFTDNLPKPDGVRTITVSPFSGEAEISPADDDPLDADTTNQRPTKGDSDWMVTVANQTFRMNWSNLLRSGHALFPPGRLALQDAYKHGYRDAMLFLLDHDWYERPEGTPV